MIADNLLLNSAFDVEILISRVSELHSKRYSGCSCLNELANNFKQRSL